MKKTLIAAAVVAAGIAGYYLLKPSSATQLDFPELAYIPADTVLMSAQLTPLDIVSYLKSLGLSPEMYLNPEMNEVYSQLAAESSSAGKFGIALLQNYLQALSEPESFVQKTGIAAQTRSLTYMVGAAPVIRFELADEAAFWMMFEQAATNSGLASAQQNLNGHSFRSYSLDELFAGAQLLVSVERGWGTIALHHSALSESHRAESLALQQPASNLLNSGKLQAMVTQYQLKADGIGYLSTEQLAQALTTTDGNQLARDLQLTFSQGLPEALQVWHTPACHADMAMLSKTWPGLVMDAELVEQAPGKLHMRSKMLFPTTSQIALEGLQSLQGFIPASLNGGLPDSMFYLGLGAEISQLTPAVSKLWAGMTDLSVSCEPLVAVQQQMKAQNPLMMLAMAGMAANGLQGLSVTINDFSLDPATGQPNKADALLTLSADNPQALLTNAQATLPPLAGITLPAAGEEVSVAELFPPVAMLGLDVRLQATDKHLLLYVGEKAKTQAATIAKEPLSKNGLFSFGMDYQQFFSAMAKMSELSGQPLPAELESMLKTNMQMGMSFAIDQHGIVINSDAKVGE
ncbi:MAG: hypothetical protein B7X50_05980 [Alishewanella sp. 34-51-39]|nr:MAG: hypothetical protein B7X50_05980 [Alishewanella sp. 34-51-39]